MGSGIEGSDIVQIYRVNRSMHRLSWVYLLLWVVAFSAVIVLIAAGSPHWFYPIPGAAFLFLWSAVASTYPKTVISGPGAFVFVMGSGELIRAECERLQSDGTGSAYLLEFTRDGVTRKLRVAKRGLPEALAVQLEHMATVQS